MIDITDKVANFKIMGLSVEIPAQTLKADKCIYTYANGEGEKREKKTFFGKVSRIESGANEPNVQVYLRNVSSNEIKLPARLYGTPDRLGVSLDTVITIE